MTYDMFLISSKNDDDFCAMVNLIFSLVSNWLLLIHLDKTNATFVTNYHNISYNGKYMEKRVDTKL
jgi:hypothetical protein